MAEERTKAGDAKIIVEKEIEYAKATIVICSGFTSVSNVQEILFFNKKYCLCKYEYKSD